LILFIYLASNLGWGKSGAQKENRLGGKVGTDH